MGRLIDIENIDYVRLEDSLHCLEHHKGDEVECVICAPTVEAIPITEMRKMLRDCADKVSDSILDIVKEEYIPKSQYENRLKADLKAILVELQLEIREHDPGCGWDGYADKNVIDCIIQEKINSLEEEHDPTPQI